MMEEREEGMEDDGRWEEGEWEMMEEEKGGMGDDGRGEGGNGR